MKKQIIWTLVLACVLIGALYFSKPTPSEAPVGEEVTAESYFAEQMVTLAIEDVGLAIEGFDDNILRMAYPGLVASDFKGVEALEGHYEIEGDEPVFVRDQKMPMSSAERTISEKGYRTLLKNLSHRLEMSASTELEVDAIIERINTGEQVQTQINQGASAFGLTITPTEVIEDSRCPVDVVCIQAGRVRVRATVATTVGHGAPVFELDKTQAVGDLEVTLIQVEPTPESTKEILDSDYVFYFRIVKK